MDGRETTCAILVGYAAPTRISLPKKQDRPTRHLFAKEHNLIQNLYRIRVRVKWVMDSRNCSHYEIEADTEFRMICLFVLRFKVPVNNVLIMSGRSHHFLGITSTFVE